MADHVRALDAERIHDRDDVGTGDVLTVARRIAWHLRRRITARGKGDAAMRAREGAHLRFPGPVIAGELVDEHDGRACARLFIIKPGAVRAGDHGHLQYLVLV